MRRDRILRIIDVNFNRALEGLRVIEDTSRFMLEDKRLTSALKNIRHKITSGLKDILPDTGQLLTARDARGDVGAFIRSGDEFKRRDPKEILKANFKRTEEALRVLEEFTKLFSPGTGLIFKKLRFKIYSLEKELFTGRTSPFPGRRLSGLYVIIDRLLSPRRSHLRIAQGIIRGGAKIVQLREKGSSDREIMRIATGIRKLTRDNKTLFIINDRVDICLAVGADGVHLGKDDMQPCHARKILGWGKIIGLSTHGLNEAIDGARQPVDYISIGPVFHTDTKPGLKPVGLKVVSRIKKKIDVPLFAIGGISEGNAKRVKGAGVDGVAVISAVMGARQIESITRRLRRFIGG